MPTPTTTEAPRATPFSSREKSKLNSTVSAKAKYTAAPPSSGVTTVWTFRADGADVVVGERRVAGQRQTRGLQAVGLGIARVSEGMVRGAEDRWAHHHPSCAHRVHDGRERGVDLDDEAVIHVALTGLRREPTHEA